MMGQSMRHQKEAHRLQIARGAFTLWRPLRPTGLL